MKFINKTIENKNIAEVGDFIFADGELRVIFRDGNGKYRAIYVTGEEAFDGSGTTEDTIEILVGFYRESYNDFELIKSEEMQLVRI